MSESQEPKIEKTVGLMDSEWQLVFQGLELIISEATSSEGQLVKKAEALVRKIKDNLK